VKEYQVDVISLSLSLNANVTEAEKKDFDDAIERASNAYTVIIHSTADEGANRGSSETLFGQQLGRLISIAASDELGNALRPSAKEDYKYLVQGQHRSLSELRMLRTPQATQEGASSVATATAAGLASLTISCNRIHRRGKPAASRDIRNDWKTALVREKFDSMMVQNERTRYVKKSRFFETETFRGSHDDDEARRLMGEYFKIPTTSKRPAFAS
jgi:hypothetical protein